MDFAYKNLSTESSEGEEWRVLPETNDRYLVSNFGRVKSLYSGKRNLREKILRQHPTGNGYLSVKLRLISGKRSFRVHKLVANAFIEIIDGKDEINHIDENKLNNRVDNLKRCDRSENVNHGCRNLIVSHKLRNRKDHSKRVSQVDEFGNVLREFRSVHDAGRFYGINWASIAKVCRGERITYKGMFFRYE